MKKFLALLTVVFLSQLLLSNARNFSFIGVEFVLAKQVEANIKFIPAGREIVTKKANILTENVYPLTQETHESIQCNNVTNVLKHSIEGSTASQLGSPFWAKTFGENNDRGWARSIQQTSDGGYIVAGVTSSFNIESENFLIIKLDSEGDIPDSSCNFLKNIASNLTVNSVTPIALSIDPVVVAVNPSISFPNPSISSPIPSSFTICFTINPIITSSAGPGGSITPLGDVYVNYGGSQTFTITPDTGYMIDKIIVDGSLVPVSNPFEETYTFTNVTTNHAISATFVLKPTPTFNVTASVSVYGGSAKVTPKEQTVKQGGPASVTINPDAGYHITKITDNNVIVPLTKLIKNANGTYTYTITAVYENHNIVVTFEKNKYIIKAKAGEGGTISPSGTVTVEYNSAQSFTVTPDPGYKVDKVTVDGKPVTLSEQKYTFINIKGNHTIEATFVKVPVKSSILITLQINNPDITVNGESKPIDPQGSKPIIKNNRTLLPIRVIIESLGGSIWWNGKTREVTIELNGHRIILKVGSNIALVDGIKTQIDPNNSKVVPIIINGRTYLPLRFVIEHLGATVDWNGNTQTITIYYWP